jgi:phosphatidylserine decarboxylase
MQDFLDALKLISFPIHREGYKFIIIFAIISALVAIFSSSLGLIGIVLTLWCIFFFRDPERIVPIESNAIVSPADGKVIKIDFGVSAPSEIYSGEQKWNKISIFLNVFNVHVNRSPLSGIVEKVAYKPGKFLSANAPEASDDNERNSILLNHSSQNKIIFTQVAGLVARRIVSDVKNGQSLKIGDRYGIIRFGSRLDVYLPENIEIKSMVGQIMIGGETIIAKIK